MLLTDLITKIEQMKLSSRNKDIFQPLRDCIYAKNEYINAIKISSFNNLDMINEIKTLKIIEIDNLESFSSYINYDYFLIFKCEDEYYFCDTEMSAVFGIFSMIKIQDYTILLRKDKLKELKINLE